jgi:hypothetical protein
VEETKLPGIGLIIVGVLSVLSSLGACGLNIVALIPIIDAGAGGEALAQVVGQIFGALIGLVCAGVIIAGGAKLMKGESYNLSMAAAVLAMVPCCSGICCIAGLPIGIWAIISMTKVKDQFR